MKDTSINASILLNKPQELILLELINNVCWWFFNIITELHMGKYMTYGERVILILDMKHTVENNIYNIRKVIKNYTVIVSYSVLCSEHYTKHTMEICTQK